jgi:hypothetical protein
VIHQDGRQAGLGDIPAFLQTIKLGGTVWVGSTHDFGHIGGTFRFQSYVCQFKADIGKIILKVISDQIKIIFSKNDFKSDQDHI